MRLLFKALPTEQVRNLQSGGTDANGQVPEELISDGNGNPCRHCLNEIAEGKKMLVLSYRPFPGLQPYAEAGPIFLCADECERHPDTSESPEMFQVPGRILIRGYKADDRIQYGTGQIVEMTAIPGIAKQIFSDDSVTYIHMRSASNNCYQCRIERG